MIAYRKVLPLDAEAAAYIAGLIDGEGTVTLTALHRGEKRRLVLSISNTDRSLLEFVLHAVGAGCISGKRIVKSHHTPSFVYKVANRQALAVLSQVLPHLRTYRAKRAEMALVRYLAVTPRNGRYTPAMLAARGVFEREFLAIGPGPRWVKLRQQFHASSGSLS